MKITIIGGGSTYTPELIEGLCTRGEDLGLEEVVLYDIDAERLEVLGAFSGRMAVHAGSRFRVTTTLDRTVAIDGAGFILSQIRVGGQKARHQDIGLGTRYGLIGQETTGVGGFAKALRTIPAVLDICRDIERLAPDAWLINFTNPSGIITETILNHTPVRALGLCNIPVEMKMDAARELGVAPERIRLDYFGLNHLAWVRRLFVDGEDVTDRMLSLLVSGSIPANIPDLDYEPELIEALRMLPLYYNRYYYYPGRMFEKIRSKPKSRAEEVMEIEDKLLALYRDESQNTKPRQLEERGGAYYSRVAVDLIDAIANDRREEHVVNLHNRGAIDGLPNDAVAEIPAVVGREGAVPVPVGAVDAHALGLMQVVKAYERLTIQAGVRQDYRAAFRALITHPLGPSADRAKALLDELLEINGLSFEKHE